MRAQDIEIGTMYRLRSSPNYGFVTPIKKYKPKEFKKEITSICFMCEHRAWKDSNTGFIRYFLACELMKGANL